MSEKKHMTTPHGGHKSGHGMGHGPGGRGMHPGGKPENAKQTIKRVFKYIEKDVPKLFLVLLFVLVNTGCMLAGSYLLRPIINNIQTNAEKIAAAGAGTAESILKAGTLALFQGIVVMFSVYLVGVLCSYLQSRIMVNISQRALCDMRNELFGKMQKLLSAFLTQTTTAS